MSDSRTYSFVVPEAPDPEDRVLAKLYRDIRVPVDRLAYTDDFEHLFAQFRRLLDKPDTNEARREALNRLYTMRKRGQLPRTREPDHEVRPDSREAI